MNEYYTGEYSPANVPRDNLINSKIAIPTTIQPQRLQAIPQAPAPAQRFRYDVSPWDIDFQEILKRSLKYLIEGLAVALVAYFILRDRFTVREAIILGVTAALTFAILDTYSPTVSLGVRFGAGWGLGQTMFGVAPGALGAMGAAAPLM